MKSDYKKMLDSFANLKLGYTEATLFEEYEINKALDKIVERVSGNSEFDRDVAQQLWEHTQKQPGNQVSLKNFIQTMLQAQDVLRDHIKTVQQKLKFQTNPADKQELQADLLSYVNDHKILTQPFQLAQIEHSEAIKSSRIQLAASKRLTIQQGFQDPIWMRTSQIFATVPSQREQSWSLKIVLLITLILLGLELLIMFHKNHFFNLMAYTLILLIFAQNFFDKVYMRLTILWLVFSLLLDFIWLIIHSENWWNPYAQTQHSTIQTGYLRLSYFLVICTMLAKILVVILLIRYFNNAENIRKSVNLFKLQFKLDGNSRNNPITQALTGNLKHASPTHQEYNFS